MTNPTPTLEDISGIIKIDDVIERGDTYPRRDGTTVTYISTKDCAVLIRRALKAFLPGYKVSVKSKVYSGGSSITVTAKDLMSSERHQLAELKSIAEQFAGATFDGMTDSTNHHDSKLGETTVSFGANFVFVVAGMVL